MNFLKKVYNILPKGLLISSTNYVAPVGIKSFHLMLSSEASLTKLFLPKTMEFSPAFLQPVSGLISQVAGFKVMGKPKRRCKDCYFAMRKQRLYVICKTHPRHKQMSMKAREKKSWILTHATQSKIRPY